MLKFKSKLAKGSLLKKKQTADIIEKIVIEFKEEFKNLNLDTLKKDYKTIETLIKLIEKYFNDSSLYDPKNGEVDKNDILNQILKSIFPNLSPEEINEFNKLTEYITQDLKKSGFFQVV